MPTTMSDYVVMNSMNAIVKLTTNLFDLKIDKRKFILNSMTLTFELLES